MIGPEWSTALYTDLISQLRAAFSAKEVELWNNLDYRFYKSKWPIWQWNAVNYLGKIDIDHLNQNRIWCLVLTFEIVCQTGCTLVFGIDQMLVIGTVWWSHLKWRQQVASWIEFKNQWMSCFGWNWRQFCDKEMVDQWKVGRRVHIAGD